MGEMIVAHDIRHGFKANQQVRTDGLRRTDTTIKRMPAVMELDFFPEVGRMSGRWLSE